MKRLACMRLALIACLLAHLAMMGGCTMLDQWLRNGLKVGPNFQEPAADVPADWIDHDEPAIERGPLKDDAWWNTFDDPTLGTLIDEAQAAEPRSEIGGGTRHASASSAQHDGR